MSEPQKFILQQSGGTYQEKGDNDAVFQIQESEHNGKNALKAQYAELTKNEKRLVRKEKALNTIATILFYTISIICLISCFWALKQIPISENLFGAILNYLGIVILGFVAIIVSFLIGYLVSLPVWCKVNTDHRIMKRNILSQACAHLREYYGLQEPCIITKCYDSSDKSFTNHDVCIFAVGDELRITTNLKHGFFHGENDLGCYAFQLDEISLSKIQGENFLIAELRAENTVFLLGYRAKGFIEKNFISSKKAT